MDGFQNSTNIILYIQRQNCRLCSLNHVSSEWEVSWIFGISNWEFQWIQLVLDQGLINVLINQAATHRIKVLKGVWNYCKYYSWSTDFEPVYFLLALKRKHYCWESDDYWKRRQFGYLHSVPWGVNWCWKAVFVVDAGKGILPRFQILGVLVLSVARIQLRILLRQCK